MVPYSSLSLLKHRATTEEQTQPSLIQQDVPTPPMKTGTTKAIAVQGTAMDQMVFTVIAQALLAVNIAPIDPPIAN